MNFFLRLFRKKPKKITLGLALGSGGAKGYALLGAIKAFEESGLNFDIISGTSIGSIIGAFISNGYSSTDILELLNTVNFNDITNLFMINMNTLGLYRVIDKTIGELNIEELKKPFFAVATELDTGEEKVFDSGRVALALCASSAYPPFFKPVIINGVRYIDGAYSNSVPCDLCKKHGADYVVGIDLSSHEKKTNIINKIFPSYVGKTDTPWQKGYENADIMLRPDLKEFSPVSFKRGSEMYEIGYSSAKQSIKKILSDIEMLKRKK